MFSSIYRALPWLMTAGYHFGLTRCDRHVSFDYSGHTLDEMLQDTTGAALNRSSREALPQWLQKFRKERTKSNATEIEVKAEDITTGSKLKNLSVDSDVDNNKKKAGVDCLCIPPYIYADITSQKYDKDPWEQCVGQRGKRQEGWGSKHGIRCNEICEDNKLYVAHDGLQATLSFCGNDQGAVDDHSKVECKCVDGLKTLSDETNKRIAAKRAEQGKIDDTNTLWMLRRTERFELDDFGSPEEALESCYEQCPAICGELELFVAGCAMPIHA
eukprot:TRINITY_DN41771_c0_g1_i1.p1 TRINITY_DN41771_c0_g1~~TRINITY_DN41771_c0_g1_i1.p1  ORF type:complete len:272 (+),score=35.27 TRINITY_DN41771_c0_g1_i1:55-870(+)